MLDNEIQQCYDEVKEKKNFKFLGTPVSIFNNTLSVWKYEAKIDEFKSIHKKLGDMKMSKGITELVNDLKAVEREVDSCSRKLDTVKVNVSHSIQ